MAFEKMLENRGVQLVLQNLIKAAAPELTNTVQQVATLIENFDARLARIEKLLTQERQNNDDVRGSNRPGSAGNSDDAREPHSRIGSERRDQPGSDQKGA